MLVGQRIGKFEILKELGSGAMGSVYQALFHRDDGDPVIVAIKIVALGLMGNDSAMARFDREANILKQLKHPHIVRLIGSGRYKQTPFIAMEYVDGEPLDAALARRGKLGWEEVATYVKQLCQALQYAHEKGIIHRDLKPSNLMITKSGILKLADFGIAKDTDVTALTGANSTIGTAAYMSPEQCRGDRNLSAKSDLYSLGICMYELITGKKPFVAESSVDMFLKHVNEEPVRPTRFVPDLPVWMDNLIMFMLEKKVDNRPLDAATVGRMIEDIEQKVQNQQSAGAEAANARKIDRVANDSGFSEEDKEVAKMLRTAAGVQPKKKKKKKKQGPWYTQVWAKALVFIVPLVAITIGLFFAFKPESREKLLAKIEASANTEEKMKLVDSYVGRFGGDSDEVTTKVKAIHTELHGLEWNAILERRAFAKLEGLKKAQDGEDEQAFDFSMRAFYAEKGGRLKEAAELWSKVKTRLADTSDKRKTEWVWVAEKHAKDISGASREYDKLKDELKKLAIDELPWKGDATDTRTLGAAAVRLEMVKDFPKAKDKWLAVAKATEGKSDSLAMYLLANQQATLAGDVKTSDPLTYRVSTLQTYLSDTQALAEKAKEDKVLAREIRNRCKEIIELYADETTDGVKTIVSSARTLLQQFSTKE